MCCYHVSAPRAAGRDMQVQCALSLELHVTYIRAVLAKLPTRSILYCRRVHSAYSKCDIASFNANIVQSRRNMISTQTEQVCQSFNRQM